MRWEIKTSTKVEGNVKYTSKWKVQYITIGDIVMMGKSAAGAVIKLAKKLPEYIENYRNMRLQGIKDFISSENLANAVNSVVQPLANIIKGMEVFKKVMNVVDSLTPIVKTVARASGVWCSPGNALDMAQIILSTVKQILIGIAVSAIIALKDWIWNFEFEIRRIYLGVTQTVIENLKESFEDDQKNNNILSFDGNLDGIIDDYSEGGSGGGSGGSGSGSGSKNPGSDYANSPEGKKAKEKFNKEYNNISKEIDSSFGDRGSSSVESDALFNAMFGEGMSDSDKCSQSSFNYITDYLIEGTTIYRMLSGSNEGKGIFYSDDGGKNWLPTAQNKESFCKFAKIKDSNGKTIYVAGGLKVVPKMSPIEEGTKGFSEDEEGRFNKDYYIKKDDDIVRLSKVEKEELNRNFSEFDFIINGRMAMNPKDEKKGVGIFYSEDDGITWRPSNVKNGSYELFFEFPPKEGYPARIVASSYDYEGIYYTDDGKTWNRAKEDKQDITLGRWVQYTPSKGTTPIIKNSNLEVIPKINNSSRRIIMVKAADMSSGVEFDGCLIGEGLDVTSEEDARANSVIELIHRKHPITEGDKVVPNDIWKKIILESQKGDYTVNDAIDGKYLEEYIK